MKFFLVGGAVRDAVMNVPSKDHDFVVVGATWEDMAAMGFKPIEAQSFPVFHHPVTGDEFALARRERKSGVGYHGFQVETAGVTLKEDLFRRDFTMNAMAWEVRMDMETGKFETIGDLIDPFGGEQDVQSGYIRHVSEAFEEDPVRVLRAARFAARYNFMVVRPTASMIRGMVAAGDLDHLTRERVWLEMSKAMGEKNPSKFFTVMCSQFNAAKVIKNVAAIDTYMKIDGQSHLTEAQKFALLSAGHSKTSSQDVRALYEELGAPNEVRDFAWKFHAVLPLLRGELTAESVMKVIDLIGIHDLKRASEFVAPLAVLDPRLGVAWTAVAMSLFAAKKIGFADVEHMELKGPAIGAEIRRLRVREIEAVLAELK